MVSSILWLRIVSAGPTIDSVALVLLLNKFPLTAGIANGALVGATFVSALPSFALSTSRGWLRAHAWLVVVCAIFTLVLGLDIWVQTLKLRANLGQTWNLNTPQVQSLLQRKVSGHACSWEFC